MKRLLWFAFFICVAVLRSETRFWIAPEGNDENSGVEAHPFATLARARNAVRAELHNARREPVTVILRAGTYALAETLVLTADDSGTAECPVVYRSADGERAVITGSQRLSGRWEKAAGTLWKFTPDAASPPPAVFRRLFRDEVALPRAREPDTGFFTLKAVDATRREATLNESLPAAWSEITGAELNTTAWWHFNRQPIARIDAGAMRVTARRTIGTDTSSARFGHQGHERIWLENALPFADEPGEWFWDPAAQVLYYRAAPGDDPARAIFSAARLQELIVLQGEPTRPVQHVHFRGVEFAETEWELPPEGRLGVQAGAWALDRSRVFSPTAAVRVGYATQVTFEHCTFRDLSEGAVAFEAGAHDCAIQRSDFLRIGANVIQVGRMAEYTGVGHPLHCDYPRAGDWTDRQEKFPGAMPIWQQLTAEIPAAPSRIIVADNRLIDGASLDFSSVGIWVGYAHHVTIEHNLLRNFPYTGISVGWRWAPGFTNCHSNRIAGNRIERVMQQVGDGAGIYVVGEQPGTQIVDNFISDSGGNYWAHGIYPDEFSNHMLIAGNFVVRVEDHSIFMHKNGPEQIVRDNNGETGPNRPAPATRPDAVWHTFSPEREPPDPAAFGPRP